MVQRKLLLGLVWLVVFLGVLGIVSHLFEDEMRVGTIWVVEKIGFLGLCAILLVTDSLVTPFPPDILLVVIAKSHLAEHWLAYVMILGLVSVVGGMIGFAIGRGLGNSRVARVLFGELEEEHRTLIKRYGFWAVAAGSFTPLPFSITCWGAGMLSLRPATVLLAALIFRVPRFVLYYWLIASTRTLAALNRAGDML